VHLASLKSPEESNRYPDQYIKHNFGVLQNVFQAAKSAGAKTFINASSSAIYGNLDSESIAESDLGEPISAYGLSKKMGEEFLYSFETRDMQICSLRLFNVIGSAHYSLAESALFHLVPATISRIKSGKRPVIFGFKLPTRDGTALRDYLHVSDVVMVFQKVAALLDHQTFRGHLVVNIGSGQGRSVLEVVNMIQKKLNSNFEPIFEKSRDGDPVSAVANINRSQNIFGFSPLYTFEQMIESCVQS
jgi:UDP-glucose 4-epimerase